MSLIRAHKRLLTTTSYDLKSAMHIPLLVLGMTPETVAYTEQLQKLGGYDPNETEFFKDYSWHIDRFALLRDPSEELIGGDHCDSRVVTRETILEYATGNQRSSALKELWRNNFAHKSHREVVSIDLARKLVLAISPEERRTHSYTYETLVVGADHAGQAVWQHSPINSDSWPVKVPQSVLLRRALCPFEHFNECHAMMQLLGRRSSPARVCALATPYTGLERYLDFMCFVKELAKRHKIDLVTQSPLTDHTNTALLTGTG